MRPRGFSVNPNVAMTAYLMCHEDEPTAIYRGLDSHHFFARALAYYFNHGSPVPGQTSLWNEFGIGRTRPSQTIGLDAMDLGGAYAACGTPDRVRKHLRQYEEAGVDQVLLICQTGRIRHEHICESLELFARKVMPEFHERHEIGESAKRGRLTPAIEAALARRPRPCSAPSDYRVPALGRRDRLTSASARRS
jgi:hypothetical protein